MAERLHSTRCLLPECQVPPELLYDSCAYVIYCPEHERVAVCRYQQVMLWFPFTALCSTLSWQEAAKEGSLLVLAAGSGSRLVALRENPPFSEGYIYEVFRLQLPRTMQYLTRLIFYLRLNPSTPGFKCCQPIGTRIYWEKVATLESCQVENVWGPELLEYCKWIKCSAPVQRIHEYGMKLALRFLPRAAPINREEELLRAAGITEKDVEHLFKDYVDHCFPAFGMTSWSFKEYLHKYGFQPKDSTLVRLFKAFNYHRTGYLTFHELLLGLAAIDPNTLHTEPRIRFVFTYYDKTGTGTLGREEYRRLVRDMMSPGHSEQQYQDSIHHLQKVFAINESDFNAKYSFTVEEFVEAVQSHRFRGTAALCRSTRPIFSMVARAVASRERQTGAAMSRASKLDLIVHKSHKGRCQRCKALKQYQLIPFTMTLSSGQSSLTKPCPLKSTCVAELELEPFLKRNHYATRLISLLENFEPGDYYRPNGLLTDRVSHFTTLLRMLTLEMLTLLDTREGKCVEVSSPCFIVGDIHGNIADLRSLQSQLWNRLPTGANILFLGDYVDRGRWSVECALYVFALKALYPHKVTLLRGNHEVRPIQEKYSFMKECDQKYGTNGPEVCELFNLMFDRLPVAAVLDEAIFAAHGGIPHLKQLTTDIAALPLDIAGVECELFWEIVWSDPITTHQYLDVCRLFGQDPVQQRGYVRNTKRGAAWYFGREAVQSFLGANQLTHMVRAHEVPRNGFTFHFGDLCATIFSSSHYQKDNKCAVLYVDRSKIRAIIIDTTANPPSFSPDITN